MRVGLIFVVAGLGIVTGCASTGGSLQRATATSIGNNIAPEDVKIIETHRSAMNVSWIAQTPHGRYSCSADDMVRRPYCVKK